VAETEKFSVPVNELHAQGFLSIGCAPARARVAGRERTRRPLVVGRRCEKECGLHVDENGVLRRGPAAQSEAAQ